MNTLAPITAEDAVARGLRPLTRPCNSRDFWMLENVLADMARGGIPAAAVAVPEGVEVWRSNNGWHEANPEK